MTVVARRLLRKPQIHAVLLFLVVFVPAWFSISSLDFLLSDTGLRFLQVRELVDHRWQTFAVDYPFRSVDPELEHVPYYHAYLVVDGQIFLSVSPFFPLLASFLYVPLGRVGLVLLPVLGAGLLLVSPLYIRATGPAFHSPGEEERALLAYLQTLPADALIAGDPCSLDDVSFYARREVLYSCWRFEEEEVLDGLRAYYAESPEEIKQFCWEYGVDYLIVNEDSLDPEAIERRSYFYEPYASMLQPTLKGQTEFALSRVPEEERLFQAGSRYVMACQGAP